MDVVPDADLLNFVDNLEEKTLKEEESNAAWNTNVLNFVVDNIEEKPLKEEIELEITKTKKAYSTSDNKNVYKTVFMVLFVVHSI